MFRGELLVFFGGHKLIRVRSSFRSSWFISLKHLVAPIIGNSIRQSIAMPVQNVNLHPIAGMELFHPIQWVSVWIFWRSHKCKRSWEDFDNLEKWPPGIIFYKVKHHQDNKFKRASLTTVHTMLRCTDVPTHLKCQWPQGWLTTCVKSIYFFEGGYQSLWIFTLLAWNFPESKNMVETRLDI